MPLATKREPFTYHDLENFPEDGKMREVIGGELIVTAAPNTRHQRLIGELFFLIRSYLQDRSLGIVIVSPVEVVFSPEDTVQPDIVFVSADKRSIIAEKRIMGAPDWVIEVLSPATRARDLKTKRKLYTGHGVVYWVLDPEDNTLTTWDETEMHYSTSDTATVSLLPGFRLELSSLFNAIG